MSEYEFTVSLRIRHPTIDPKTISATLARRRCATPLQASSSMR